MTEKVRVGRASHSPFDQIVITKADGGTFAIEIGLIADLLAEDDTREEVVALVQVMLRANVLKSLGAVRCPVCGTVVENQQRHHDWHVDRAATPEEASQIEADMGAQEWPGVKKAATCDSCGCLVTEGHECV